MTLRWCITACFGDLSSENRVDIPRGKENCCAVCCSDFPEVFFEGRDKLFIGSIFTTQRRRSRRTSSADYLFKDLPNLALGWLVDEFYSTFRSSITSWTRVFARKSILRKDTEPKCKVVVQ